MRLLVFESNPLRFFSYPVYVRLLWVIRWQDNRAVHLHHYLRQSSDHAVRTDMHELMESGHSPHHNVIADKVSRKSAFVCYGAVMTDSNVMGQVDIFHNKALSPQL